ncbi:Leu/Phe/Val dehydrogenase [Croceibacterium soli]|uniref:Leu/Phe/Val dehydrogenase n=1 Tax=Croceibacterium soli TaxID=1739690 RepID=UPI002E26E194|nr:Glu/Leu/Phe/Val dehydrogenase dimerization domain-containing protein [Croceibacterium soli]
MVPIEDRKAGLQGVIVIHSTRLGPAGGGCRLWSYPTMAEATDDGMRLAAGMSYKNALAGLPLGGGKAVLRKPDGDFCRQALFEAFGLAVERLGGRYVTAEDVGTSVADMALVSRRTGHVAGLARRANRPGGDPSPHTARGVFLAMRCAVERRLGRSLGDVTVAVQGLGHVGYELCRLLHAEGARLIVAEPRSDVAARAAVEFGAEVAGTGSIVDAAADVFAPCAMGGVLDSRSVPRLKASVVCGAANNQLADPALGALLADRGVLYAPDYLVNAGGIINVAAEYLGWATAEVDERIAAIPARLAEVLDRAERTERPTGDVADEMAREVLSGAPVTALQ